MENGNDDWLNELLSIAHEDPTPEQLAAEHHDSVEMIRQSHPLWSALSFSSLLMAPEYQPNAIRLESLIHLCIAFGGGTDAVTAEGLTCAFEDLGNGRVGLKEDPIEDVFVNNVVFKDGNFRVADGSWESGAFYLQRFLDVLDTCPDEDFFGGLRANAHALLVLSEEVFRRFDIQRYSVGREYPNVSCPPESFSAEAAHKLLFSHSEIEQLGLTCSDLAPFILTDEYRTRLGEYGIGQSPMQQLPLVRFNGKIAFVLPTATTYAIRMYLIRRLLEAGYRAPLQQFLGGIYQRLFQCTPRFGIPRNAPRLFADSAPRTAAIIDQFDTGRYLHILFVLDDLEDIKTTGVGGVNQSLLRRCEAIRSQILHAEAHASKQEGFRSGLTLVVTCGVGRGGTLPIPNTSEDWLVEGVSAPDLVTLAWARGIDVQKLWIAISAFSRLSETDLRLFNINGLLNLISWMQSNDWQVAPHANLPKQFRKNGGILQLPTNALLSLRSNTTQRTDQIGIFHPTNGLVVCRRFNESYFPSDDRLPLYVPESAGQGTPIPFVYRSRRCDWWCLMTCENSDLSYDRWLTLKMWIPRLAQVVEAELRSIPTTVEVRIHFAGARSESPVATLPSIADVRADIGIRITDGWSAELSVGDAFEQAIQAETNVAETALVAAICSVVGRLGSEESSGGNEFELAAAIIPNAHARHLHGFQAREFRDFVTSELQGPPIQIDEVDSAAMRIGLAFRVESRQKGRHTTKKKNQSTKLLNAVVRSLEDELAARLQQFDRKELVVLALLNHERAMYSRKRWMRTAVANLAVRGSDSEAAEIIRQQDSKLSSTVFLSQAIAETATSDGAVDGGGFLGECDLRELMSLANAIAQLAGWSAAIHLDAMPPGLTITALGDIQADQSFQNDIVMPFSDVQSQNHLDAAVDRYSENFQPPVIDGQASTLANEFESAWVTEIGVSLDSIRLFIDVIEDLGIEKNAPVYAIRRSLLKDACGEKGCPDVEQILDAFTLVPRPGWRTVTDPYESKDVQIWRYRRQLSAVRRPILQLDNSSNPEVVIAPGFIRNCVGYTVDGYYEGTFPARHYRTTEMRSWHDVRGNQRGAAFAAAVADACCTAGWECREEMYVKTLIQCTKHPTLGDTRRYGEVDVVAWNVETRRLLLIECKHLYHGKTAGEIAEQLSDYRGEEKKSGRKTKRDELRKHLDRIEVLKDHSDTVLKTLGLDSNFTIEGWVVFRNPVPMLHTWRQFAGRVSFAAFDDLASILITSDDAR